MRFLTFFLYLGLLPLSIDAHAADDCYRRHLVVDRTEIWNMSEPQRMDFFLPTKNASGIHNTYAAAHIQWDGKMDVQFDHVLPEGMTGLAYNLYRVEIQVNEFVFNDDLTKDCRYSGRSFFGGEGYKIYPFPIPAFGPSLVRVRVWGR